MNLSHWFFLLFFLTIQFEFKLVFIFWFRSINIQRDSSKVKLVYSPLIILVVLSTYNYYFLYIIYFLFEKVYFQSDIVKKNNQDGFFRCHIFWMYLYIWESSEGVSEANNLSTTSLTARIKNHKVAICHSFHGTRRINKRKFFLILNRYFIFRPSVLGFQFLRIRAHYYTLLSLLSRCVWFN